MTDIWVKDGGVAPRRRRAQLNWLLTALPAIMGLTAVQRFDQDRWLLPWITLGVPILVGILVLIFVAPGIRDALAVGEYSTALLLGVPPLLGPLLTGPVPAGAARFATHWPAVGAALVAPLVIGVVFLRAPVMPNSAVETGPSGEPVDTVVRGAHSTGRCGRSTMPREAP